MANYYVNNNPQPTGEHEVHEQGCIWLGLAISTTPLGWHDSCRTAVAAAQRRYLQVDGCASCSPFCHTR